MFLERHISSTVSSTVAKHAMSTPRAGLAPPRDPRPHRLPATTNATASPAVSASTQTSSLFLCFGPVLWSAFTRLATETCNARRCRRSEHLSKKGRLPLRHSARHPYTLSAPQLLEFATGVQFMGRMYAHKACWGCLCAYIVALELVSGAFVLATTARSQTRHRSANIDSEVPKQSAHHSVVVSCNPYSRRIPRVQIQLAKRLRWFTLAHGPSNTLSLVSVDLRSEPSADTSGPAE